MPEKDTVVEVQRSRLLSSESCWDLSAYSSAGVDDNDDEDTSMIVDKGLQCSSDILLCMEGAEGALCGACAESYIYSSAERVCIKCSSSQDRALIALGVLASLGLLALVAVVRVRNVGKLPQWAEQSQLWGVLKQVDSGALKVAWSNYQVRCCSY